MPCTADARVAYPQRGRRLAHCSAACRGAASALSGAPGAPGGVLAAEAGPSVLRGMVARRMERFLGEAVHQRQAEVVLDRLSAVFRHALFAVAFTSLKVVRNGMLTSKSLGGGALTCRFGCLGGGGDDARHHLFALRVLKCFSGVVGGVGLGGLRAETCACCCTERGP